MPVGANAPATPGPRVVVLFDTAGFLRSLPLTGAAARTLHLNRHLPAAGCPTTVLLCDLNPKSRPTNAWPVPVRYLRYEQVYGRTDALAELAPDVLVMSNTQLVVRYGRTLADTVGAALVYEMHDDEAAVIASIGGLAADVDAAAQMQAAAAALADGVIAFTDRDAALARGLRARAVHVVPCGVDPGPPPERARQRPGRVVFVGNLYYEPNMRAVRYLRRGLAPALASAGGVIDVFGRYPRTLRGEPNERVRLRGPVGDLRAALATATVGVAPLDSGGGMKCKVLEYMAAGLPIVATPEALVGLADPQEFALVSTAEAMTDLPALVTALLDDALLRRRLGKRGRFVAEHTYSWAAMAQRARHAYAAIRAHAEDDRPAVAPAAEVIELAGRPSYWLREWRTRQEGTDVVDPTAGARPSVVDQLAHDIDCARLAAESALDTPFDADGLTGFGGRSVVFFAPHAVLKVYTHRWSDRLRRELAGLKLAGGLAGMRVPVVLGHDDVAGALAWVALTRLEGTMATQARWAGAQATELIGRLAARLHSAPAAALTGLPDYRRNVRDLPTEYPAAFLAGTRLEQALTGARRRSRQECVRGFVHGDFSSRNILLTEDHAPGVIDFEGCGAGCVYDDLATLYTKEVLLGERDGAALLAGYADELTALGGPHAGLDEGHLYVHIASYARWVLQWAPATDPEFTARVIGLAPGILARLDGAAG
jgi:glycosyltransferase involved in cell wall biosynthesis/aminoglycoside phosphotransferase